jgi:hypothetical protein
VREFLGRQRFFGNEEIAERTLRSLVWLPDLPPTGGDVLFVEATRMK